MIYLLDTNVISDWLRGDERVISHANEAIKQSNHLVLCSPIYYEVMRGLLYKDAKRQIRAFDEMVVTYLDYVVANRQDWQIASQLWATTVKKGRQLSDIDLLLAAIAKRLQAVIITSDRDFNIVDVTVENWRE